MATDPQPKPSFSPFRKWGVGLHVLLLVLVVFSVLVMVGTGVGEGADVSRA